MVIQTSIKDKEDLDLLCNTLNAEAGRFMYTDQHLRNVLLRAQAAIVALENELNETGTMLEGALDSIGRYG